MLMKMPDNQLNSPMSDGMMASVSSKIGMGGGTATSIFGWMTTNEAAVLIGLCITVIGFLLNLFFQYKREKRTLAEHELKKKLYLMEIEEHQKRMNLINKGVIPSDYTMHIHNESDDTQV